MSRRILVENLLAFLIASACVLSPCAVVAQTSPAEQTATSPYDDYFMSDAHRQEIYEGSRKKPGKAVLYSLLVPGLGNIYAEQYLLAGIDFIFVVFAGTFLGYGLSTGNTNVIILGGVTAGIAYGGGIATSLLGVSSHNERLRQELKVQQTDVREVWAPALVMRF